MKNLFLFSFIIFGLTSNATNYYFSTVSGDDSRTAAQAQIPATPWKTLNKLNSFFSLLKPGDNVLLNRGDVFYGSIIIKKNGTSGSPITIGAYGTGAKPVITGFLTVSEWTAIGGGMYTSTGAVTTATTLNMVTFQDTMQPMGRWPKLNSNSNGGYLILDSNSGDASITSSAISGALSFIGGEVVQRKYSWILDRGRITNQTATKVSYNTLIGDNHSPSFWTYYDPINTHGFFFQNHVNACTVLGEWAHDSKKRKIKMFFGDNSPGSYTIKVTNVESLVSMTSNCYIIFDNIEFKGSNSRTFNIATSHHIEINNCDIKYSGVEGIYVSSSASNNIKVYNCSISYTNNNAINGNGSTNWIIQNNILNKTGTVRGAGLSDDGQYVGMTSIGSKSLIQYNVVKNTGYIGIHFLGDSVTVKNNFVDSFCLVKNDGGGIYAYGGGSVAHDRHIIDNIVLHGIGDRFGLGEVVRRDPYSGDVTGIFLDGGASNLVVTGNTVAWTDYNGFQLGGSNITLLKNTAFDCMAAQFDYAHGSLISNLIVKHNILFAKEPKTIVMIVNSPNKNPLNWGIVDSNYYCRPIYEPTNVEKIGYIGRDFGGIMEVNLGTGYRMKSLDNWQSVSGQDAHSLKSPKTITNTGDIRFEYNATTSPVVVPLPYNYMDAKGATYNGTITIAPFSSAVLIKNGAIINQPPKANAGPDQTIILPSTTINLSGSGTDPDGTISSYLWTIISGPTAYTIANINSASTSVIELVQGVYKFELKVTDNNGAVGKDTMQVTVNAAANLTSVANAGSGSTITLPDNKTSCAESSSDAEKTIASYSWRKVSGPATFTFVSANAATSALPFQGLINRQY